MNPNESLPGNAAASPAPARLPDASLPPGSPQHLDDFQPGTVPLSLNRSPADPSQPQIPATGPAATRVGLGETAHPLAAKTPYAAEKAELEGKIDRLREDVRAWWKALEPHEGALAGDVKGKLRDLDVFLANHLHVNFNRANP